MTTGKVEDYLKFKAKREDTESKEREKKEGSHAGSVKSQGFSLK